MNQLCEAKLRQQVDHPMSELQKVRALLKIRALMLGLAQARAPPSTHSFTECYSKPFNDPVPVVQAFIVFDQWLRPSDL